MQRVVDAIKVAAEAAKPKPKETAIKAPLS